MLSPEANIDPCTTVSKTWLVSWTDGSIWGRKLEIRDLLLDGALFCCAKSDGEDTSH